MTDNTVETVENTDLAEKLADAGKKAEAQKSERRERVVKGSHLLPQLRTLAEAAGMQIEEKSGFLKINAGVKGKNVYVAKKGGRVDLSGFTLEDAAVTQISETEAQEKHLGKVRGQLNFEMTDEQVLAAYSASLELAKVPNPEPVKAAKAPKAEAEPAADAENAAEAAAS